MDKDTKVVSSFISPGFEVGDIVAINVNGEAVPAGSDGAMQVVGVVSNTEITIVREPDVVERLAAVVDDDVKKDVESRRPSVRVRTTMPYQGEVDIQVAYEDP